MVPTFRKKLLKALLHLWLEKSRFFGLYKILDFYVVTLASDTRQHSICWSEQRLTILFLSHWNVNVIKLVNK